MAFTFQIKRRLAGEAGPPPLLYTGELAYNEVSDVLYIGVSNSTSLSGASGTDMSSLSF